MGVCLVKQNRRKEKTARKRNKAAINLDFLEDTLGGVGKFEQV